MKRPNWTAEAGGAAQPGASRGRRGGRESGGGMGQQQAGAATLGSRVLSAANLGGSYARYHTWLFFFHIVPY